ncbi:MAG: SEC-C domain-containing protein [Planctomycetota bacterium]
MAESQLPVVVRADGATPAERYLQGLCERSFLSLWSYPSLFRDQRAGAKGDGKELCDLLVVFGDDILIFSDKSCAFPATGDTRLDWSRWFRKAIMKSAEQAWGAERWLREHRNRIFIDRACVQPFPLDLPPADRMRVHHIVVAHNVVNRCRAQFSGGSGSLIFNSDLTGGDHYADPKTCSPFEVGWLDDARRFVHVLDDVALEVVLRTQDTITDFVGYLRAKEDLLQSLKERGVRFFCAGEEELLAHYVTTMRDGGHAFDFPDGYNAISIPEGDWAEFQKSPERSAQLEADRVSYCWDMLIEKFNANILGGTSYYTTNPRIAEREKILRFFAREPRTRRRLLADALLEIIGQTGPRQRGTRIMFPSNPGDPNYCFLALPKLPGQTYDEYREVRRNLLMILCHVTKLTCPDALDMVGLATETDISREVRSEDALYVDLRGWNEEMAEQARDWQRHHNLLTNLTKFEGKVSEYPERPPEVVVPGPNPRNKPCPCGSGKKYKKCHGR